MHNQSALTLAFSSPAPTVNPVVRAANRADVEQIWELISCYVAEGLMLPRTLEQVTMAVDNYVVAAHGSRILACAALDEYSPSLAEVSSVAVAKTEHGKGLGTEVVLGVERLARTRDITELFALSLSDRFFLSLDYEATAISRYPEKLARYGKLASAGVDVVPKRCFKKLLGNVWEIPALYEPHAIQLRAS